MSTISSVVKARHGGIGIAGALMAIAVAFAAPATWADNANPNSKGDAQAIAPPSGPAPGQQVIPPKKSGKSQTSRNSSKSQPGTLSHRLNRSNGVIAPHQDVDPGMSKAAPNPGPHSTPVIPAPGAPGSGSNVEPK